MDSINQQQPEDNVQHLAGEEARAQIKKMVEETDTCFFCTEIETGKPFSVRPMAVQKVDDEGNVWFLSSKDSNKDSEAKQDPYVQLLFQQSQHSGFLSLYGTAQFYYDKEKIKELWKPIAKVWFTEGEDDPRISVIKVKPVDGYYWDNKHGKAIAFAKMVAGMVTGQTLDDSVEGKLKV